MNELLNAIKKHSDLDNETIEDAGRHGADAGFSGFTYNSDCIEFYDNNEFLIDKFAQNQSEEYGYSNQFEMIIHFNRSDILEMGIVGYKILMSWFVLEEVGRYLLQQYEDKE